MDADLNNQPTQPRLTVPAPGLQPPLTPGKFSEPTVPTTPARPASPSRRSFMGKSLSKLAIIGGASLSGAAVALIVKARAAAAGLDAQAFAGHSLRAGFCTTGALKGLSETTIASQSGHKSIAVLRRYAHRPTGSRSQQPSGERGW